MNLGHTCIFLGVKFGNLVNFFWTNSVQFQPNLLFFRGRIHQIFNLTEIEKISLNSLLASLSEASIKLHLAQENVKLRLGDPDCVLRGGF
jgi:hypothetical protein